MRLRCSARVSCVGLKECPSLIALALERLCWAERMPWAEVIKECLTLQPTHTPPESLQNIGNIGNSLVIIGNSMEIIGNIGNSKGFQCFQWFPKSFQLLLGSFQRFQCFEGFLVAHVWVGWGLVLRAPSTMPLLLRP